MNKQLTGLFGYPVEHSLSPAMHNAAFKELGLNSTYLPFAVKPDNLKEAVRGIKALNIKGVNLTIPHKQKVISYLDQLSNEAKLIGAVNTIENQEGKLIGHNTDGRGYIRALQEEAKFNPSGKKVLVIGAGGAARAVAFQLSLEGINELYIANRTIEKAKGLVKDIKTKVSLNQVQPLPLSDNKLADIIKKLDLIIDTTPVGMHPQTDVEPVISAKLLHSNLLVSDLVYNPQETVLLQEAKKVGAETLSGLGMLLYQGVIAFEIWTGKKAPKKVMRRALEEGLKNNI
ncbi:shikimate 5-dehydrogenase [Halobacteroides halobius DSM 5150]|uniref:Shikimate dehydrogenase (NADP(+)) n=1 Tax=Halobacteroides halobius (strain ATCC 35273 / DSM 5150 / MD-1) TaxID=748449 RepID=L0K808_HALHC|nr:shikimate dehydrogenase [Halobacteroides halobius]AGB40489.1 shikimate 5-dehydrogenase [Halobacteroides halobius DSM 5150]